MPTQKITRDELLLKALTVFRRQGYHHTSMSALAAACGLFKGSFYHYFDSKEALMRAVLDWVRQSLEEKVFAVAYDETLPPAERLGKLLRRLNRALLNAEGGCIVGNTTLETAKLNPEFRGVLKEIFDQWLAALTHLYATAHPPETAARLARQTVAELEGAVMLAQLYGSDAPFVEGYERALGRLAV